MNKAKFYDSAYPGSMSLRDEGGYVDREDSTSLAEALLQNLHAARDSAEDWKDGALRLEKENSVMQDILRRSLLNIFGDNWREDASRILKSPNAC